MCDKDDGEPAFPFSSNNSPDYFNQALHGMTLRDYFAAQALAGNLSCPESSGTFEQIVKKAYEYADAMIAARKEDLDE